MNYDNLHELINRYESNIDILYNEEHDELFKWRALKTWQEEWTRPASEFSDFAERYLAAKKNFDLFIDNSRMHPSTGVIKLWEKEPESVEKLFNEVLFGNAESVTDIQSNMERFLDGYELLRQKYFPGNWSYKQDRHSASVFLAVNEPSVNFVFKSTEANRMARYTEFGLDIGYGANFSLPNYYALCDEVVAALKEHKSLLEKHFDRLDDRCFRDETLHLLAFDIMYCCNAYNFYKGLVEPVTKKTIKKKVKPALSEEEIARIEAEKTEKISAIQSRIAELENKCSECADISLINVQVTFPKYGTGIVVEQDANRITVRFSDVEKKFALHRKYTVRPTFENDEEIVSVFTEYADAMDEINRLKSQLDNLI